MITPYQDIKKEIYNKVIIENWPKDFYREINDLATIKNFYNHCFDSLNRRLENELNKYHPASWILEAYKQLELWSVIFHKEAMDLVSGYEEFAPIGRYGWRFVIEVSLEKLKYANNFNQDRPCEESLNTVFTLFLGMGECSELSNYLHFLNDKLSSTKIVFSPNLLTNPPEFDVEDKKLFEQIKASIATTVNWDKYEQFAPNNEELSLKVDLFLKKHFSISIDEIYIIIASIVEGISNRTNASITVQPYDDFVRLVNKLSRISVEKIKSLIEISFLNIENKNYEMRDFLRKNQPIRMLFNAGVVLDLESHFETIYDSRTALMGYIKDSKKHIIISPRLFCEWLNMFVIKIVTGQRIDLKKDKKLKHDLIAIETSRTKDFEKAVTEMMYGFNFYCLNLSKYEGKYIECGEIDIVGFNKEANELFIVECKAYAPIIDARGLGQVLNDHYNQKKYHEKFLKKIKWVSEDRSRMKIIFKNKYSINISEDYKVIPFFITCTTSTLNLIEDNYKIMTFYEFDSLLKHGYKKNEL